MPIGVSTRIILIKLKDIPFSKNMVTLFTQVISSLPKDISYCNALNWLLPTIEIFAALVSDMIS